MLCRWAQELLGYSFAVVHRPAKMMSDVDCLTRRYCPSLLRHQKIANILRQCDNNRRPLAFLATSFPAFATKIKLPLPQPKLNATPVLTSNFIACTPSHPDSHGKHAPALQKPAAINLLFSNPPQEFHHIRTNTLTPSINLAKSNIHAALSWSKIQWICVNDTTASLPLWVQEECLSNTWNIISVFEHQSLTRLFNPIQQFFKLPNPIIIGHNSFVDSLSCNLPPHCIPNLFGIDFNFVPLMNNSIQSWLTSTVTNITHLHKTCLNLSFCYIWIPLHFFKANEIDTCSKLIQRLLLDPWTFQTFHLNSNLFN